MCDSYVSLRGGTIWCTETKHADNYELLRHRSYESHMTHMRVDYDPTLNFLVFMEYLDSSRWKFLRVMPAF